MSEFTEITLNYDGNEYLVPADKIWGLAEAVEDIVTFTWLAPRLSTGEFPAGRIFRAYASALRYAGCKGITAEELRQKVGYKQLAQMAYELSGILMAIQPSADMELGASSDEEAEKVKKKATAKRSKPATKRG
jgi:hypothetical protein